MRAFTLLGLTVAASAQLLPSAVFSASYPAATGAEVGKGAKSQTVNYNENAVVKSTYNNVFANGASLPKRSVKRTLFEKRHENGDCSPQTLGSGPSVSPDTPEAFVASSVLANYALNAATPAGYTNTFKNLNASNTVPMGYLGYDSISSYDPSICSGRCDSITGCMAFDIYFERDPTVDPGVNCTNPPSTNVIKCAYWGTDLESSSATNDGQYCADFHMVIAGSNGYVKSSGTTTLPGYNGTVIGQGAINAPTECNSYIGYQLFNDGMPFDPARCAAACDATSAYNIQYLNSRAICRFFDTYILNKNGIPVGQYCAMYTRSWDASYATNTGQLDTDGNVYTVSFSYTYSNTTDPGANICDATCMSQLVCPVSSSSSTTSSSTTIAPSSTTTPVVSTTPSTTPVVSTTTSKAAATTTPSTTPSLTTTTSKASTTSSSCVKSTTPSTTSSTTSKAAGTTPVVSTTPAVSSSTTKCTTTTLQTTTKAATTTTTSSSTTTSSAPTSTSTCFKIRGSAPSYVKNYIGLDSNGRMSYAASASATVFTLGSFGRLTTGSGQGISRTIENWWNPSYGYMSTSGLSAVYCLKGSNNALTCSSFWAATPLWSNSQNTAIMQGTCPGNGWDNLSLTFESAACPTSSGSQWGQW